MSTPKAGPRPQINLAFSFSDGTDLGTRPNAQFSRIEFKGMMNGGYIVYCKLFDPEFSMLRNMIDNGYLDYAQAYPIICKFQLLWGPDSIYPSGATRQQTALVIAMRTSGQSADIGHLEFIAIDPPSWYLNTGDASGKVYKGRVSDVFAQIVAQYAPSVVANIGRTVDSTVGKWYMMRQDPKSFLGSIIDWSSSITQQQTHWLVIPDGFNLTIKEQAELSSTQRAYYRYHKGNNHDTLKELRLLADNALSISKSKLVTHGMSAISGRYLDRVTDKLQQQVFVKDLTTPNKVFAKTDSVEAFTGPDDGQPPETETCGWTSIASIPEFSGGDLGKQYQNWIDGRARGLYLNMMNALMRGRFRVLGHGEWDSCTGLGTDTMFVKWLGARGIDYFLTGNWIVYGFHHILTRKSWTTDVYAARFQYDATGKKVGS